MSPWRSTTAVALLLFLAVGPGTGTTPDEIAKAIRQLGDDSFDVREKATQFLWKTGSGAEPALHSALKTADPEVRARARRILERFKYGIYPDTPPHIVEVIQQFRAGDAAKKGAAVNKLLALGTRGCLTVLKLAAAEEDLSLRRTLFQQFMKEAMRISR